MIRYEEMSDTQKENFKQIIRNEVTTALMNPYISNEIVSVVSIAPNLHCATVILNNQMRVNFLVFSGLTATIFMETRAIQTLLIDPSLIDVRNAIKDYHSIGHQ